MTNFKILQKKIFFFKVVGFYKKMKNWLRSKKNVHRTMNILSKISEKNVFSLKIPFFKKRVFLKKKKIWMSKKNFGEL